MTSQTFILCSVMASISIALNADSPILPHMVKEQMGVTESQSGFAVGVIQGSYSFAQFFSSFYIGHVCDKIGRKPVLVFGMLVCAVCTATFGLATSFLTAAGLRTFMGLANSNNALARSCMADIAIDMDSNRRNLAFAYLGACFSLARSMSSALTGGLASIPHQWFFPSTPYFFPMAGASVPIFMSLLAVVFFFRETRSAAPATQHSIGAGLKLIAKNKLLNYVFGMYGLSNIGNAGILILLVLFGAHPVEKMGLGLTVGGVSVCFWIFGSTAFIFQFTCFKSIVKRLGIRKTYAIFGGGSLTLACLLAPTSALPLYYNVPHARMFSWFILVPALTFSGIGFMTLSPCINAMMMNATDPSMFGLASGTGQSIGSLLRGCGPLIFGPLFSATSSNNTYYAFVVLAGFYLPGFIWGFFLPEELERSRSEAAREEADAAEAADAAAGGVSSEGDEKEEGGGDEDGHTLMEPLLGGDGGVAARNDHMNLMDDGDEAHRHDRVLDEKEEGGKVPVLMRISIDSDDAGGSLL